jgi:hypothetical protein
MRGLRKVAVHSHAQNDILVTIVAYPPPAVLRAAADLDQTHRACLELVVAVPESVTEAVLLVTAVVVTVAGLEVELAVPEGARGADNQGLGWDSLRNSAVVKGG